MEISVKLLSKVLVNTVFWMENTPLRDNMIRVHFDNERYLSNCEDINIHELTHKLKEWAYSEGYEIEVTSGKKCSLMMRSKIPNTWTECFGGVFNSEYEAVVKACEWIMWEKS